MDNLFQKNDFTEDKDFVECIEEADLITKSYKNKHYDLQKKRNLLKDYCYSEKDLEEQNYNDYKKNYDAKRLEREMLMNTYIKNKIKNDERKKIIIDEERNRHMRNKKDKIDGAYTRIIKDETEDKSIIENDLDDNIIERDFFIKPKNNIKKQITKNGCYHCDDEIDYVKKKILKNDYDETNHFSKKILKKNYDREYCCCDECENENNDKIDDEIDDEIDRTDENNNFRALLQQIEYYRKSNQLLRPTKQKITRPNDFYKINKLRYRDPENIRNKSIDKSERDHKFYCIPQLRDFANFVKPGSCKDYL
jgi:hypothetical protein